MQSCYAFDEYELSLRAVKTDTNVKTIQMTDLRTQYQKIRVEVDAAISEVLNEASFINGPSVSKFATELSDYMGIRYVIPCGNGTDALQIALMALDLPAGSEIITPGFSYAAVAEVCALLGLKAVFADVESDTFNIDAQKIEELINPATRVILPVHLFGQCANMPKIMEIANRHNLYVVEDNAQSVGAMCLMPGQMAMSGTMGHLSTMSFFPSKNLGCYGDGGAVCTNDEQLAARVKMIANHGQSVKYYHEIIGVNSRLDTIQAAILSVKLKYLNEFTEERRRVAAAYDAAFEGVEEIEIPFRASYSTHVFHQYTLKLRGIEPEQVQQSLKEKGIPSMVYYPLPLYKQKAYFVPIELPVTETLCKTVLSLPMGTDMSKEQIEFITFTTKAIVKQK